MLKSSEKHAEARSVFVVVSGPPAEAGGKGEPRERGGQEQQLRTTLADKPTARKSPVNGYDQFIRD